jgi:hypothetical protein
VPTFLFSFAKSSPEVPNFLILLCGKQTGGVELFYSPLWKAIPRGLTFLFFFVEKRTGGVESFKKSAKIECNIKYNRIFVTTNLVSALSGGTSAPPCPVWNVGG